MAYIQCMPCFSQIISEMLSEIHTVEKCDFLLPVIRSQIFNSLLLTIPHEKYPLLKNQ